MPNSVSPSSTSERARERAKRRTMRELKGLPSAARTAVFTCFERDSATDYLQTVESVQQVVG